MLVHCQAIDLMWPLKVCVNGYEMRVCCVLLYSSDSIKRQCSFVNHVEQPSGQKAYTCRRDSCSEISRNARCTQNYMHWMLFVFGQVIAQICKYKCLFFTSYSINICTSTLLLSNNYDWKYSTYYLNLLFSIKKNIKKLSVVVIKQ